MALVLIQKKFVELIAKHNNEQTIGRNGVERDSSGIYFNQLKT